MKFKFNRNLEYDFEVAKDYKKDRLSFYKQAMIEEYTEFINNIDEFQKIRIAGRLKDEMEQLFQNIEIIKILKKSKQ